MKKAKDMSAQIAEQRSLQCEAMARGEWYGDREVVRVDGTVAPAKRTDTKSLMTKRITAASDKHGDESEI